MTEEAVMVADKVKEAESKAIEHRNCISAQFKDLEYRIVATQEEFDKMRAGTKAIMKLVDDEPTDLARTKESFMEHLCWATERLKTFTQDAAHALAMYVLLIVRALYPRKELVTIGEGYLVMVEPKDIPELRHEVKDTVALLEE
ncbi:hypothetical protein ABZP36_016857 [Zizania latifolia]